MLKKYSDLTYKVKHTMTGYEEVVHVDRMMRKYSRDETVIGENVEIEKTDRNCGAFNCFRGN